MTGFDLPQECQKCGWNSGWYVPDNKRIFVHSDGSVRIGRDNNTRWSQKIKARCNNPSCDAVVDIYIEAESVNNGEIRSTGAKNLLQRLREHDALPKQIERGCTECGQEFVTDIDARLADDGGIDLNAKTQCPQHPYTAFIIDTVEHLPPGNLENKWELLPEANSE